MSDFMSSAFRGSLSRALATASVSFVALAAAPAAWAAEADAPADSATAPNAEAAAEAADAGNEIIVTARHREERLQDVPLAISSIAGGELNAQHLDRVSDYTVKVPNFGAIQQNTRVSGLYIRGVGGNASNDGAEGGVGLIVDNVFFTHVGFSWLDFVDLEGVEVVRGPQGTLLGKNTTIGAVIVRTAKPKFDPELNINATYGGRNRFQVRANATGPIIADKLAYRVTFATDQGGGWIRNAYDGAKYLDNSRWSVRGQLLFTPASNISSRLIVEHYETREYNNFYPASADVNANLNLDGSVRSVRAGSWTNKLISLFGYTPSFDITKNANLNSQQRLVSRTNGISNELNWDFGGATLTSVSAWRQLYFRPYNDSDLTPLPIFRAGYDVDVDQYSQELRLASNKGGLLDWQVGAYYLHEDLVSDYRTIFYSGAAAFLTGSNATPSAILNGIDYSKRGKLKIDSGAVFGQATLHLTDAFSLTGGVRFTRERKQVNVTGSYTGGATLPLPALNTARSTILASLGGTTAAEGGLFTVGDRNTRNSVAWLVNPSFKVNDNILLYGSASYGEKSGAANTTASTLTQSVIITQPEKSLDFEAGFKTTWLDRKLTLNVNFYNNTIKGYQAAQVDTQRPTLGSYLANVGKVRLRGVEFETTIAPVPGLTLNFNGAYNDAKYLNYANAPAPLEFQAALGGATSTLSLTGYQITGAPKWVLQGGYNVEQPIGGNLKLTSYATVSYRSRTALLNPRSVYGWQNAYALVNAGIGLRTENDRYSILLWSKNLFDKRYAAAFGAASANTPIITILGEPRTWGVTLSGKF